MPDINTTAVAEHSKYKITPMSELLTMVATQRNWLLYPFIQEKALCMLYAKRGTGKTFVGLSIALGIASGMDVMTFQAKGIGKVLYIDGEMAFSDLQERVRALALGFGERFEGIKNLAFLSADLQNEPTPNLTDENTQKEIEKMITDIDFIVIDNISVLCHHGRENEAESWLPMQKWLLNLKRMGKTVLVIDHAGKNGDNRGTSKKQDIMDAIIKLEQPDGYKATDGACFIVCYTKSRAVSGDDLSARKVTLRELENGTKLVWDTCEYIAPQNTKYAQELARARELRSQGLSTREIAQEMGFGKTKAAELVKASAAHEPMPETPVALAITDGRADEPQSIGEILAQKPL